MAFVTVYKLTEEMLEHIDRAVLETTIFEKSKPFIDSETGKVKMISSDLSEGPSYEDRMEYLLLRQIQWLKGLHRGETNGLAERVDAMTGDHQALVDLVARVSDLAHSLAELHERVNRIEGGTD